MCRVPMQNCMQASIRPANMPPFTAACMPPFTPQARPHPHPNAYAMITACMLQAPRHARSHAPTHSCFHALLCCHKSTELFTCPKDSGVTGARHVLLDKTLGVEANIVTQFELLCALVMHLTSEGLADARGRGVHAPCLKTRPRRPRQ